MKLKKDMMKEINQEISEFKKLKYILYMSL